nr:uncharacterized protein LOC126544066 [Dermacentor andersoni]
MKKRSTRGLAAGSAGTAHTAASHSRTQPRQNSDEYEISSDCSQHPPQERVPSPSACQQLDETVARPGVITHVIDGLIFEEYTEPPPSSFVMSVDENEPPVLGPPWCLASPPAAALSVGENEQNEPPVLGPPWRLASPPAAALSVSENEQNAPPVLGPPRCLASPPAAALDKCTSLPTTVTNVAPTMSEAPAAVVNTYQAPIDLSLASAAAAALDKCTSLPTTVTNVAPTMSQAPAAFVNTYEAPIDLSLASAAAAALDKCTSLPTTVTNVAPTMSQAPAVVVNTYQAPIDLSLASAAAADLDECTSPPTTVTSAVPTMSQAPTAVMNTYQSPNYDRGPVSLEKPAIDQFTAPLEQARNTEFFRNSPREWTVEEVTSYIWNITGCAECAEKFRTQQIDGEAMLLLEENHLMAFMNIKLGPALIICSKIRSLQ